VGAQARMRGRKRGHMRGVQSTGALRVPWARAGAAMNAYGGVGVGVRPRPTVLLLPLVRRRPRVQLARVRSAQPERRTERAVLAMLAREAGAAGVFALDNLGGVQREHRRRRAPWRRGPLLVRRLLPGGERPLHKLAQRAIERGLEDCEDGGAAVGEELVVSRGRIVRPASRLRRRGAQPLRERCDRASDACVELPRYVPCRAFYGVLDLLVDLGSWLYL
jgi:hypothetical protein